MEETNNTNINLEPKKAWNGWKSATVILIITTCCGLGLFAASLLWKQDSETGLQNKIALLEANQAEKCAEDEASIPEQKPVDELPETPVSPEVNEAEYLTVKEWGIRFKIPDGFTKLTYSIRDNRLDFSGKYEGRYMPVPKTEISFDSANYNFPYIMRYTKNDDPCRTEYSPSCEAVRIKKGEYIFAIIHLQQDPFNDDTRFLGFTTLYLAFHMFEHMEAI